MDSPDPVDRRTRRSRSCSPSSVRSGWKKGTFEPARPGSTDNNNGVGPRSEAASTLPTSWADTFDHSGDDDGTKEQGTRAGSEYSYGIGNIPGGLSIKGVAERNTGAPTQLEPASAAHIPEPDFDAPNPGTNIYIKSIAPTVTAHDLAHLFGFWGTVTNCNIIPSMDNVGRIFAFVTMSTVQEADRVLAELQGTPFHGYPLRLEKAIRACGRRPTPGRYMGNRLLRYDGSYGTRPRHRRNETERYRADPAGYRQRSRRSSRGYDSYIPREREERRSREHRGEHRRNERAGSDYDDLGRSGSRRRRRSPVYDDDEFGRRRHD